MHKKRKNLHKYLIQAASADDVVNNHALGKVARSHRPVPQRRPLVNGGEGSVAGYRDSMVGSIAQYRDRMHRHPAAPEVGTTPDSPQTSNRQSSALHDKGKIDNSIDRRHHFVEPPKRNFNRFG